jgi:MFS family permease
MLDLERKVNLEKNIWKYTLLLIANKRVFVAILGAYYLTIPGVDARWIGIILFASAVAGFLFEIPSGYISDKFGHKQALVVARVLMVLSTLFFLLTDSIQFLLIAGILMSISQAFHSGAGSAFMHETLRAVGKEEEYAKIMGKASSIGFAIPIIFMVLVPFLAGVSYKAPFIISLAIDLIGLFAAFSLTKPPVTQEHIDEVNATNFKQVMREGHRLRFFRYAFFSSIIGGVLFAIGGFRAPYQIFLEIPVIWFGVLVGIGRAFASLMLAYSGKIRVFVKDRRTFYRYELMVYTILLLLLGGVSAWWVAASAFVLINAFHWGLSQVQDGYLLDIIKGSKFKATLLSTQAQINELVAAATSLGLGFLIAHFSYRLGFLTAGLVFFVVLFPLYLFIIRSEKEGCVV